MKICPKLVAAKLERMEGEALTDLTPSIPRAKLKEILWFVQGLSIPPRGRENLTQELIKRYPDQFGTKTMTDAGHPKGGKYTLEQCLAIWNDIGEKLGSGRYRDLVRRRAADPTLEEFRDSLNGEGRNSVGDGGSGSPTDFEEWLAMNIYPALTAGQVHRGEDCDKAKVMRGYQLFNWEFLHGLCIQRASEDLAGRLLDMCALQFADFRPPWYCHQLYCVLGDYMEAYEAEIKGAIAETEVTKIVFRELTFAWSQNVPVPIVGESRIGKTSPAGVWCAMRPGRARLVTVPESNRERDFLEAHADAYGIDYTDATTTTKLRSDVKYVLRQSGLFTVYDESQFLIPVTYHKNTAPARLNFVRCQVIDKNLGCAFFATPQTYKQTLEQYVKTTGYRVEQWLGRIAPTVVLPSDLGRKDLLAIAKAHFLVDVPEPYLRLIVARAMRTDGYIKSLEITAKRARFIAAEHGHLKVEQADVEQAIADMLPETGCSAASATAGDRPARASQAHREGAAEDVETDEDTPLAGRIQAEAFMGPNRLAADQERERAGNLAPA